MRNPFHSSHTLRGLFLFSFVALSLIVGCGKLRSLFTPSQKEAENPHSVTIGWNASSSPVQGYNVYRASPPGAPVKLTTRIVSGTQYTDRTVEAGHTYTYSVTSVDFKGTESVQSANIAVTVPTTVTPTAEQ